ncbi:MAG: hypothetical protein ACTS5A_03020 [Candidatus Hodgkinia cicadicola]
MNKLCRRDTLLLRLAGKTLPFARTIETNVLHGINMRTYGDLLNFLNPNVTTHQMSDSKFSKTSGQLTSVKCCESAIQLRWPSNPRPYADSEGGVLKLILWNELA